MNWLVIISHAAAESLSYYNAVESREDREREHSARQTAWANWVHCEDALIEAGMLHEFMAAGKYLI